MSGKEDDELKREARDEAFARRGAHMLERMHVAAPAVDCLDTEIIAAYADRSLNAEQAAHCEEHFASCAKCRAVLRAMLAAESELASAALNKAETASAGILSPAASASRPSDMGNRVRPPRTDWRLRWLAPAMGIAAALALMIVIRGPWRRAETPNPNVLVAQGPEAKSSQPMGVPIGPNENAGTQKDLTGRSRELVPQAGSAHNPAAALKSQEGSSAKEPDADRQTSASSEDEITSNKAAQPAYAARTEPQVKKAPAPELPPPPIPVAPPPAAQVSSAAESASPGAPQAAPSASAQQTVTATEAAPLVGITNSALSPRATPSPQGGTAVGGQRASDLPTNGRQYESLAQLRPGVVASGVVLQTPSGRILWHAGKGGSIEQSADGGKTWIAQQSPSPKDWLAGAAVSDSVAWLAGRNGAIARTQDGQPWQRVTPPPQAADASGKMPDWASITAQNALSATVTALDGRRFTTRDGGKTWIAQ